MNKEEQGVRIVLPQWLQGSIELFIIGMVTLVCIGFCVAGVWFAGGASATSWVDMIRFVGHTWLFVHGVRVDVGHAHLSLFPWTFTLIPVGLAWRAGRRIALFTGSFPLWVVWLCGAITYSLFSILLSFLSRTDDVSTPTAAACFVPTAIVSIAMICGSLRVISLRELLKDTIFFSQTLWAASHDMIRSIGAVFLFLIGVSGCVVGFLILSHWAQMGWVYEKLDTDIVSSIALTLVQCAFLPTVYIWVVSWFTGAGFFIGSDHVFSPLHPITPVLSLPDIPFFAALPSTFMGGFVWVLIPVMAGMIGGFLLWQSSVQLLIERWIDERTTRFWISHTLTTGSLSLMLAVGCALIAFVSGLLVTGSAGSIAGDHLGIVAYHFALLLGIEVFLGSMGGFLVAAYFKKYPSVEYSS